METNGMLVDKDGVPMGGDGMAEILDMMTGTSMNAISREEGWVRGLSRRRMRVARQVSRRATGVAGFIEGCSQDRKHERAA
ncbi:MAG: hypothetical protein U9R74_10605 [Pseudomonadota bacterium]|nr:hypothetical protein [Pseudomonadota bacterium]